MKVKDPGITTIMRSLYEKRLALNMHVVEGQESGYTSCIVLRYQGQF